MQFHCHINVCSNVVAQDITNNKCKPLTQTNALTPTATHTTTLAPTCYPQHINTTLMAVMSLACDGHQVAVANVSWSTNDKSGVNNHQQVTIAFVHCY